MHLSSVYSHEIPYKDPLYLFLKLPRNKNSVFLDGAMPGNHNSQYSFIGYDPFSIISCDKGVVRQDGVLQAKPAMEILSELLQKFSIARTELTPFAGGLAGYFSYEFLTCLEPKIKLTKTYPSFLPDFVLGIFDLIIAFDHVKKKSWIYSSGLPETGGILQKARAKTRIKGLLVYLEKEDRAEFFLNKEFISTADIKKNVTYDQYCAGIQKALEYIHVGDIYQANLAQRFNCFLPESLHPFDIYQRLRIENPAPFSAYVNLADNIIASASPERFMWVQNNQVVTSPIKGTCARSSDLLKDKALAASLYHCEKNRAENVMIVDLMRNDLSRVCKLGSIKVPRLYELQSYATVHHLVSQITGKLKEELNLIDLLAATFPGGSITGAPKFRAMQIINEIEMSARGPYCGSIGYIGFDGTMDTSIVIRSFVIKNNFLTFHVGGGIVADSHPHEEYIETLIKASALYRTLTAKNIFNFLGV